MKKIKTEINIETENDTMSIFNELTRVQLNFLRNLEKAINLQSECSLDNFKVNVMTYSPKGKRNVTKHKK